LDNIHSVEFLHLLIRTQNFRCLDCLVHDQLTQGGAYDLDDS
jgi:hypothetical protein